MAARVAGIAYVKVDGRQYPLRGGFTIKPSALVREGIAGQDGPHGFSENPSIPEIRGDITLTADVSMDTLRTMTDVTVTAELANGKAYVLRSAWTTAAFELNAKDGQVGVVWQGLSCDEI
jgi:hypothetical protein